MVGVFIVPRIPCAQLPLLLSRYCPPSPAIDNSPADLAICCPPFLPRTVYSPDEGATDGDTDHYATKDVGLAASLQGSVSLHHETSNLTYI